eukprot:PITA_15322
MPRNKSRTLKLKATKFCILDSALFWKDPGGMLLNCLVEEEAKGVVEDFHRDVYKAIKICQECQIFEGKQKLQPLPLKPIEISAPFQQWGLDFIGEIHLASSGQHRWILTATNYFTKWIEAIPTRQATDAGNGLAESSNKSLVNIIKKLLEINKKGWHKKLVNALWADRVSQKKSIGMSPFELVYGTDTVFPTSLAVPVVILLQEAGSEEDPMQRRINQMIHL